MAPHPFSRYRLRLFHDFLRLLAIPTVTFFVILRLSSIRLGYLTPVCGLVFLVLSAAARNWYSQFQSRRIAKQYGGRLPREVVGKWPGNFDLALQIGKAALTMYPGEFYRRLFEEYQCTTLNLRLFWTDTVSWIL